jgi:ankyrin repeat protein
MEIVNLLLEKDITNINQTDFMGNTILHRAVVTNNLRLVEALVEKGAKVDVKNTKGETPFSLAKNGKIEEFLEVAKAMQQTL